MEWPPYCEIEDCRERPEWYSREHDQALCPAHCDNWDYPNSPIYPAHSSRCIFYVGDQVETFRGRGHIYLKDENGYIVRYFNGDHNVYHAHSEQDLTRAEG